ncbi:MAG: MFS transporter [Rhodospirillales bacterium]|nr:MFS transporter [Rhodospirillales bacterium]
MSPTDQTVSTENLSLVVTAVTGVQTLITMSALLPAAIAPELSADLGVGTAFIGYQIAIVYGAGMVTSIVGGSAVRCFGACRVSQGALALCAVGTALAMFPWPGTFALASILIGFGYGLTNPASSHLLERVAVVGNRNLVFSIKQTGVPLGGIVAGLLAPALTVTVGWPWAFASSAVAAVAAIAALQPIRLRWDADRDPTTPLLGSPWSDIHLVWTLPTLRWLSLAALCFAAVQLCLTSFLVALLVEELHFGLVEAGVLLGFVQASGAVGRLFWGWLADRVRDGFAVLLGMTGVTALGAGAVVFLGPDTTVAVVFITFVVLGFTAIGWNGVYLAEVARASPRERISRATGGSLVFTFAGVLSGPPVFAFVSGELGSFTGTFAFLVFVTCGGWLSIILSRRESRVGGKGS